MGLDLTLVPIKNHEILAMRNSGCGDPNPDVFNPWNEAVIAFVKALPKDTPIVLWWH